MRAQVNPVDRRAHPRLEVSIPGLIFLDDGREEIVCRLTDISVGGARIVLQTWQALSPSVQLIECKDGRCFLCELRWQNRDAAGLEFVDICPAIIRRKLFGRAWRRGLMASVDPRNVA